MPVTRLICPHCETNVELTVTSVTRSRECPHCGKMIILQFTTKETRIKRKALLMPAQTEDDSVPAAAETPTSAEPQRVLGPDVHRRMLHDPEVQTNARRLGWGVAVVGLLITLMVVGNYLRWWAPARGGKPAISKNEGPASREESKQGSESKGLPTLEEAKGGDAKAGATEPSTSVVPGTEQEKALKAVISFFTAKNVDERLNFVLGREALEPKIRAYYAKNPDGPIAYARVKDAQADAEGAQTFAFNAVLEDGKGRRVVVGMKPGGEYAVDWSSFVLYGDLEWAEFMEKKPHTPTLMRVLVKADDYYNHNFSDARSLGCLRLSNPKGEDSPAIFAYYSRTTTLGREMEFVMRRSFGESVPMTLTLNFPEDPQSNNQVWVDERLAEGWVLQGR